MDYHYTIMDKLPRNKGLGLAEIEAALSCARMIIETLANEIDRHTVAQYIVELELERDRLVKPDFQDLSDG